MLRFKIGSIPVQVHGMHPLFSALLAMSWLESVRHSREAVMGQVGWPVSVLAQPDAPGQGLALAAWVALFVGMAFVSILAHELGHAFVSRAFGYRPTVDLVALGGVTRPNANETIPWFKEVTLTLAGPGMGLLLGLVSMLGARLVAGSSTAGLVFSQLVQMNFLWSVFNLLPIAPLDGGQVMTAVLIRVFGRVGFLVAQVVTLLLAVGLALLFMQGAGMMALLVLVFVGFRAVQMMGAYLRGEVPALEATHPSEVAFREAVEHFESGRLREARQLGEAALALDMTPSLRSRYHHLLGWAVLKEGLGREALDHFSQVGGREVEPQALAAAFSLVGDEARALPLWEQAAQQTGDSTVLHEFAGSLLRAGREAEARGLPGVQMEAAWACAERLLFLRGEFAAAAAAGEAAFREHPTAGKAYDVACAHARGGQADRAVEWLGQAARLGYTDGRYARTDDDLRGLHGHPGFTAWLTQLGESAGP